MEYLKRFYNGRIALVHLDSASVEVLPLSEGMIADGIGGAAINTLLLEAHMKEDPLVFGTGPLTGSFAPASCLMVATFRSPGGDVRHVPFMLKAGPQLKFSGIDFMVIAGKAEQPSMIELLNGTIRVLPADNITGLEIPEAERILMASGTSFPETVLIAGPAAENDAAHACVSMGLWGSLDKASLAGFMASKSLRGVTMNASGGIAFPQENIARGQEMVKAMQNSYQRKKNPVAIYEMIDGGEDAKQLIKKLHKKSHACYHCPFPCMSYLEFKWNDGGRNRKALKRQGLFILDHKGFAALAAKRLDDAPVLMKRCIDLGLDPCAVAELLPRKASIEASIDILQEMAKGRSTKARIVGNKRSGHLPEGNISPVMDAFFGSGIPPFSHHDTKKDLGFWEKRIATAMVLGVCPILMLVFTQFEIPDLLRFITMENGELESLQKIINQG